MIVVVVSPPSGKLTINGEITKQTGHRRVFHTVPLQRGKKYGYEIVCAWGDEKKTKRIDVVAGGEYLVEFDQRRAEFFEVWKNYGINLSASDSFGDEEYITLDGKQITYADAMRALESHGLRDDSDLLRLTIIGDPKETAPVIDDLRNERLAENVLVQAYRPTDWAVARCGFKLDGKPCIYIQRSDGKVLHRQDDYSGGIRSLMSALDSANQKIRKPDPRYDPSRDPDNRPVDIPAWWPVGAALLVAAIIYYRTRAQ